MFDNDIEKIEKTDELFKWRTKINKVFSMIKNIFPDAPKDKKTMLVSDGENLFWVDIPEKYVEPKNKVIDGILTTEHIVVNNIANFNENIEVNKNVLASSLQLQNNAIIKFSSVTYYASIKPVKEGLQIDGIIVNKNKLSLEELKFKHCRIYTTEKSLIITANNENTPFFIDFTDNTVHCLNGLYTPKIYFDNNNVITAKEYPGNAKSANKLSNSVKIYGNQFDGTRDLTGIISDCVGIKFVSEHSYIEYKSTEKTIRLQEEDGIITLDSEFYPQKLHVKSGHYAEYYQSNAILEKGDVISYDFNSNTETYVKVNKTDGHPLGVVTDDFSMIIGDKTNNSYPVCNRGRVYAKVIGKIKSGDKLTVSAYDGILCKHNPKDKLADIWAIALESSNNEDVKLIKIHI